MGLVVELDLKEFVTIGDHIKITVDRKPGKRQMRLIIDAPREMYIKRFTKNTNKETTGKSPQQGEEEC